MAEDKKQRDYELAAKLSKAGDDLMVGVEEVAAVMGLSPITVRQRRLAGMPSPLAGIRALRWRLGDIRTWMRGSDAAPISPAPRRRGKPTKAETLAAAAAVPPADSA
jgi:hypothetical protein